MTRQVSPLATLAACAALFLGSFGDEAAQVTFALRLAEGGASAPLHVSALLATGLLGGIASGMITPRALLALGVQRLIAAIFVTEAVLIAAAAFADTLIAYLAITAVLGCLGSMLWSAVLVLLPALNMSEAGIARANRVVQSVRNLGYVVGPLLGSVLYAWSSGMRGLLILGAIMLCSAIGIALSLPRLITGSADADAEQPARRSADVAGLLRTPGMVRAIAPLLVTVLVTSALNVLLIVRVRIELGFSAEIYGVIVAALSTGLVIGPIMFAGVVGKLGEAAGASVAAAAIGVGIVAVGSAHAQWQLMAAAFLIGIANGVQNALMAGFVIQRIDAKNRAHQMPAYVLILQTTVFIGFVCAALIKVDQAGTTLLIIGAITIIVGTIGAIFNRTNKEQPSVESTI